MTGHFVGKGKYLCKGRKNSFNSFLRYSYFQLTTSLYINPQVVYITQHTHTDLELILKRILKIMISKGVAGTKNSFQFLILKSWRKAYCILTFIDIVFAPAIYFLCIYSWTKKYYSLSFCTKVKLFWLGRIWSWQLIIHNCTLVTMNISFILSNEIELV